MFIELYVLEIGSDAYTIGVIPRSGEGYHFDVLELDYDTLLLRPQRIHSLYSLPSSVSPLVSTLDRERRIIYYAALHRRDNLPRYSIE